MATEPTEDSFEAARSLLAKAAATIDVDEAASMTLTGLPEPHSRRWPVLAAAAAVVLAIGGGYLVTQQLGDDPQPVPPPADSDHEPVEQEHVYADDELPSLLGYTENEATELLQSRGYPLEVQVEHSCDQPAGYVLGTDPGPGTPMAPGDQVRVRVTGGPAPNVRCAQPPPTWQQVFDLARFARGLGPAPDFPGPLSIAVGEGEYVELTAEEAADPESWILCEDGTCHSALAALEQILTTPEEMDDFYAQTFLVVTADLPGNPAMDTFGQCLTPDPHEQGLPYHSPTYVYVNFRFDGPQLCPPSPVLQIGWTEDHEVASIRLRLASTAEEVVDPTEPTAERQESAEQFVAWARGEGPVPTFTDRVRVMFGGGGAFGSTGWANFPEEPNSFDGCSGAGFPQCGLNPVAVIYRHQGSVVATVGRSTCADGGEVPKRFAEAEDDVVRLEEPESASCRNAWAVELWIDEDGVIYGVNQAGMN